MKTIVNTLAVLVLAYTLQACNFNLVKGNGTIVSKEITITDYNAIKFSGGASLTYEQKPDVAPYLRIEIDENIFPLLIIESENGILTFKCKDNISPTKYNIYTNSSGLEQLRVSGSLKANVKNKLVTDKFDVHISGSGTVQVDALECNTFKSSVSGSGDIILAGSAKEMNCSISGSGKINAWPMVADSVYCKVSGSGDFEVHAIDYLNVSISGSGSVMYKGEPRIDQSISGSGKVKRAE